MMSPDLELVINLRTAKAIGLTGPRALTVPFFGNVDRLVTAPRCSPAGALVRIVAFG